MADLKGKIIIVTGAGRGIGRAVAFYLAAQGASVVVNDVDKSLAVEVAAIIFEQGGYALAVTGSVSEWDFTQTLIAAAVDEFGRLDGLVNNAGLHYQQSPSKESPEAMRKIVEVNILGAMYCGAQALNVFIDQGEGSLVNVTSGAHLGVKGQSIYSATKGAIASLTYSWALDAMPHNVRINAVAPLAKTRMTDALPMYQLSKTNAAKPPPVLPAEAIAPVFGYLLGDGASSITGQILRFNGKELTLINPPGISSLSESRASWDMNDIQEAIKNSMQKGLNPVGLGSKKYAWNPPEKK